MSAPHAAASRVPARVVWPRGVTRRLRSMALAGAAVASLAVAAARATRPRGVTRRLRSMVVAGVAAVSLAVAAACAQDFAPPAPAAVSLAARSGAAALEHGLPDPGGGLALEALGTSWHAVPGLVTRAAVIGVGWRALRVAAGLSQTGDAEIGWQAAGLAAGAAGARAGAALRIVARRDLTPLERARGLGAGVGLEAGAGAWIATARGVRVWASAPQVARAGVAAPLARPLAIGVELASGAGRAWLSRIAPVSKDPGDGESVGGAALALGGIEAWLEARDDPLRGTIGIAARTGALGVAASVESHPVLGETARLALTARLGGGR